MSNQKLYFDVTKEAIFQRSQQLITGRVGDGGLKATTLVLTSNQEPYDLTGKTIAFLGEKADGCTVNDEGHSLIIDPQGGIGRYVFPKQAFSCEGEFKQAYFKIMQGDLVESTLELKVNVLPNTIEFGINSSDYLSEYDRLIKDVQKREDDFLEEMKKKEEQFLADLTNKSSEIQTGLITLEGKESVLEEDFEKIMSLFALKTYERDAMASSYIKEGTVNFCKMMFCIVATIELKTTDSTSGFDSDSVPIMKAPGDFKQGDARFIGQLTAEEGDAPPVQVYIEKNTICARFNNPTGQENKTYSGSLLYLTENYQQGAG